MWEKEVEQVQRLLSFLLQLHPQKKKGIEVQGEKIALRNSLLVAGSVGVNNSVGDMERIDNYGDNLPRHHSSFLVRNEDGGDL